MVEAFSQLRFPLPGKEDFVLAHTLTVQFVMAPQQEHEDVGHIVSAVRKQREVDAEAPPRFSSSLSPGLQPGEGYCPHSESILSKLIQFRNASMDRPRDTSPGRF